jgi:hypothetical protein
VADNLTAVAWLLATKRRLFACLEYFESKLPLARTQAALATVIAKDKNAKRPKAQTEIKSITNNANRYRKGLYRKIRYRQQKIRDSLEQNKVSEWNRRIKLLFALVESLAKFYIGVNR